MTAPRSGRALAWLERERVAVLVPVLFGCVHLTLLRGLFNQDAWLALVAGRDIAHHGLPKTEQLTLYAHGVRWVDQQWLAQLAMYGLERLGGLPLVALVHVLLGMVVVAIAVAVARRNGASPLAVAAVALIAFIPFSFVLAAIRTQIFGAVAFAIVLALLVTDARRPGSRRVWLVIPVVAVWANLHGSVLLGSALVALRGLTILAGDRRAAWRGVGLVLGAGVAAVASPYLLHLPEYYGHTAFNHQFSKFVGEWRRATPNLPNAPFYVLILVAAYGFVRRRRALTSFEWLLLLSTAVAGLLAVRNAGWFAMAAVMTLPTLWVESRQQRAEGRLPALPVIGLPVALLLALFVIAAVRANAWFDSEYPAGPLLAVQRVTSHEREARVYADVRLADWLLWRDPTLAGRIAYDARYELLSTHQIDVIRNFNDRVGDRWQRAVNGYRVVVLQHASEGATARSLLARSGSKLVYGAEGGTVLTMAQ